MENSEEISSVALLSPACYIFKWNFSYGPLWFVGDFEGDFENTCTEKDPLMPIGVLVPCLRGTLLHSFFYFSIAKLSSSRQLQLQLN